MGNYGSLRKNINCVRTSKIKGRRGMVCREIKELGKNIVQIKLGCGDTEGKKEKNI